jgi:gas vesicle protein
MADELPDSPEMNESESMNRIAWFLTGAIIGATVAILYAPKSGRDTRQLLTRRAQEGKDAVAETTMDLVESGKEMFERGRKIVEDAADLFERGRKMVRGQA